MSSKVRDNVYNAYHSFSCTLSHSFPPHVQNILSHSFSYFVNHEVLVCVCKKVFVVWVMVKCVITYFTNVISKNPADSRVVNMRNKF